MKKIRKMQDLRTKQEELLKQKKELQQLIRGDLVNMKNAMKPVNIAKEAFESNIKEKVGFWINKLFEKD